MLAGTTWVSLWKQDKMHNFKVVRAESSRAVMTSGWDKPCLDTQLTMRNWYLLFLNSYDSVHLLLSLFLLLLVLRRCSSLFRIKVATPQCGFETLIELVCNVTCIQNVAIPKEAVGSLVRRHCKLSSLGFCRSKAFSRVI